MQPTSEQSAETLRTAKVALDSIGIPFCLFLGTSLGAYRDHDFCPGDTDDTDIAVDITYFKRAEEIIRTMNAFGFDLEHQYLAEDGIAPEFAFVQYHDNGSRTKVDIFFITEVGGKMTWRFYLDGIGRSYQTRLIDKKYFKSYDKVEFFGTEYNVPHPIEEYLEANYGEDWKTPIHRGNWNWHEDNHLPYKEQEK